MKLSNLVTILAAAALCLAASLPSTASALELKVTGIKDGGKIPLKHVFNSFGCTGKNVSPGLEWSDVPEGTKSIAVTVYDPDAPTGSGWWHWLVFNIPASAGKIPEGAGSGGKAMLPKGAVQSRTDYGKPGYGGPCPPEGDKPHRYVFTVFALKDTLDVGSDASGAMVGFNLNASTLETAKVTATYGR